MTSFAALMIAVLLVFQGIGIYGEEGIYTGIAEAPPYNGSWYLCSDIKTDYISFSVKVLEDQTTPVTEGFPGQKIQGAPPKPLPKFRPALIVYQLNYDSLVAFSDKSSNNSFLYVPSLSCYQKPVQICEQDVGNDPLDIKDIQCLLLQNPTAIPVRFNVSVSFTKTVFNQSFTSPDVPGGTASSATNYKFEYGIGNLMVTILFSTILIYNVIGLF